MFRSWIRPLSKRRSPRIRRPQTRLRLESLENRCVPAITVSVSSLTAVEGQPNVGIQVATFTDTGLGIGSYNVTVDYGDGSTPSTNGATGNDPNLTVTNTSPGNFSITDNHTFRDEAVAPAHFTITVTVQQAVPPNTSGGGTGTATVGDAALHEGGTLSGVTQTNFSGVGGTNTSGAALTALNAFEAAIGGVNNGANPPPQTGGFRAINWDGVKLDGTDFGGSTTVISQGKTVGIPTNRFQERGVQFEEVYAVSGDGFQSVNPNVSAALFPAFSPNNTFAMFNQNSIGLSFVLPSLHAGTPVPAATTGFGAIFRNVEIAGTTSIEYFSGDRSLGKFFVPVGTQGQAEFLGELFSSPVVTSVQITLGTDVLFSFNGTTFSSNTADSPGTAHNLVVTDDFVYAEPTSQANVTAPIKPVVGTAFTGTVATFTDDNPNAVPKDFTATITWGDGHTSPGTIAGPANGAFTVSGTNTFGTLGSFPISVLVQDLGGNEVSLTNKASVSAGDQNHRFVAQVYSDLLGRLADNPGLQYWGGLLDAAILNRNQVVSGIEASVEYRTLEVNGAYLSILLRNADPGGLNFFVPFLANGGTVEQMRIGLASSPEFFGLAQSTDTNANATTSGQKFVDFLYLKVLNRNADSGALSFFGHLVDTGTPQSTIANVIVMSSEGLGIVVNGLYTSLLHHTADSGGLNFFVNALQKGTLRDEQIIAALAASDEYFARV
jgi:hypothetical protein